MVSKSQEYELESILYDVKEKGYSYVGKYKVWRLLGKGSNAAGTWKALLDSWVELGDSFKRTELRGVELPSGDFIFTSVKADQIVKWAGEAS